MSFEIWNRRYTGSKYKLTNWIVELIESNCEGETFCDLFAGTAVVSAKMLNRYKEIRINDLLYSNYIIYQAFFAAGEYNTLKLSNIAKFYNDLLPINLRENYISKCFGNKFYSENDARLIGYIRQDINNRKNQLTVKEYNILLASLLYSADKVANTVGHYDAYIKGKIIEDRFIFNLISPYDTSNTNIIITRKDANQLCKEFYSDIVYIDPPYNSRQYSRFYHVLENIVQWKKPNLFGEAMKPEQVNMSEFCRNAAPKVFDDLISNLNCKYIVVSYNNTYKSKSSSSKNKIEFDSIVQSLKKRGSLSVFEKEHPFFNAGKTSFEAHKEYVFILKVGH